MQDLLGLSGKVPGALRSKPSDQKECDVFMLFEMQTKNIILAVKSKNVVLMSQIFYIFDLLLVVFIILMLYVKSFIEHWFYHYF